MARIREYELDRDLEINDKVLGTDYSGGGTMNFSIQQLGEFLASRGLADPSATDFQFRHVDFTDGSIGEGEISYDNLAPIDVTTVQISVTDLKGQDTGPLAGILPTTNIEINDTQASVGTDYGFFTPSAVSEIDGGFAIQLDLASVIEMSDIPSATMSLPTSEFVNLSIIGLAGSQGTVGPAGPEGPAGPRGEGLTATVTNVVNTQPQEYLVEIFGVDDLTTPIQSFSVFDGDIGDRGPQGFQGAFDLQVYQFNVSQPATPTDGSYVIDTGVLTEPSGWFDTILDAQVDATADVAFVPARGAEYGIADSNAYTSIDSSSSVISADAFLANRNFLMILTDDSGLAQDDFVEILLGGTLSIYGVISSLDNAGTTNQTLVSIDQAVYLANPELSQNTSQTDIDNIPNFGTVDVGGSPYFDNDQIQLFRTTFNEVPGGVVGDLYTTTAPVNPAIDTGTITPSWDTPIIGEGIQAGTYILGDHTTDELPEGSANLYYTDARAQGAIDAFSTITDGTDSVVADGYDDTLNVSGTGGIDITLDDSGSSVEVDLDFASLTDINTRALADHLIVQDATDNANKRISVGDFIAGLGGGGIDIVPSLPTGNIDAQYDTGDVVALQGFGIFELSSSATITNVAVSDWLLIATDTEPLSPPNGVQTDVYAGQFIEYDSVIYYVTELAQINLTGDDTADAGNIQGNITAGRLLPIRSTDTTITDGSLNPITSNAVFDALALKANLAGGNTFSDLQTFEDNITVDGTSFLKTTFIEGFSSASPRAFLAKHYVNSVPTTDGDTELAVETAISDNIAGDGGTINWIELDFIKESLSGSHKGRLDIQTLSASTDADGAGGTLATRVSIDDDGIDLAGNITLTGNVDGVDIAALETTVNGKVNFVDITSLSSYTTQRGDIVEHGALLFIAVNNGTVIDLSGSALADQTALRASTALVEVKETALAAAGTGLRITVGTEFQDAALQSALATFVDDDGSSSVRHLDNITFNSDGDMVLSDGTNTRIFTGGSDIDLTNVTDGALPYNKDGVLTTSAIAHEDIVDVDSVFSTENALSPNPFTASISDTGLLTITVSTAGFLGDSLRAHTVEAGNSFFFSPSTVSAGQTTDGFTAFLIPTPFSSSITGTGSETVATVQLQEFDGTTFDPANATASITTFTFFEGIYDDRATVTGFLTNDKLSGTGERLVSAGADGTVQEVSAELLATLGTETGSNNRYDLETSGTHEFYEPTATYVASSTGVTNNGVVDSTFSTGLGDIETDTDKWRGAVVRLFDSTVIDIDTDTVQASNNQIYAETRTDAMTTANPNGYTGYFILAGLSAAQRTYLTANGQSSSDGLVRLMMHNIGFEAQFVLTVSENQTVNGDGTGGALESADGTSRVRAQVINQISDSTIRVYPILSSNFVTGFQLAVPTADLTEGTIQTGRLIDVLNITNRVESINFIEIETTATLTFAQWEASGAGTTISFSSQADRDTFIGLIDNSPANGTVDTELLFSTTIGDDVSSITIPNGATFSTPGSVSLFFSGADQQYAFPDGNIGIGTGTHTATYPTMERESGPVNGPIEFVGFEFQTVGNRQIVTNQAVSAPQGDQGPQGIFEIDLYQRSTTAVTAAPSDALVWDFDDNAFVSATFPDTNGWQDTVPSGSDQLYIVRYILDPSNPDDATENRETIATTDWSSPFEGGAQGAPGSPGDSVDDVTAQFRGSDGNVDDTPEAGDETILTFDVGGTPLSTTVTIPSGQQGGAGDTGTHGTDTTAAFSNGRLTVTQTPYTDATTQGTAVTIVDDVNIVGDTIFNGSTLPSAFTFDADRTPQDGDFYIQTTDGSTSPTLFGPYLTSRGSTEAIRWNESAGVLLADAFVSASVNQTNGALTLTKESGGTVVATGSVLGEQGPPGTLVTYGFIGVKADNTVLDGSTFDQDVRPTGDLVVDTGVFSFNTAERLLGWTTDISVAESEAEITSDTPGRVFFSIAITNPSVSSGTIEDLALSTPSPFTGVSVQGPPGSQGVGIDSITQPNGPGTAALNIVLDDPAGGTPPTVGPFTLPSGPQGNSVTSIANDPDDANIAIVTIENTGTSNLTLPAGPQGDPVSSATRVAGTGVNPGDTTNIEFFVGTDSVGVVTVPAGAQGQVGEQGVQGLFEVDLYQRLANGAATPARPTGTLTYNVQTAQFDPVDVTQDGNGWLTGIPAQAANTDVWILRAFVNPRVAAANGNIGIPSGTWLNPFIGGEIGPSGPAGDDATFTFGALTVSDVAIGTVPTTTDTLLGVTLNLADDGDGTGTLTASANITGIDGRFDTLDAEQDVQDGLILANTNARAALTYIDEVTTSNNGNTGGTTSFSGAGAHTLSIATAANSLVQATAANGIVTLASNQAINDGVLTLNGTVNEVDVSGGTFTANDSDNVTKAISLSQFGPVPSGTREFQNVSNITVDSKGRIVSLVSTAPTPGSFSFNEPTTSGFSATGNAGDDQTYTITWTWGETNIQFIDGSIDEAGGRSFAIPNSAARTFTTPSITENFQSNRIYRLTLNGRDTSTGDVITQTSDPLTLSVTASVTDTPDAPSLTASAETLSLITSAPANGANFEKYDVGTVTLDVGFDDTLSTTWTRSATAPTVEATGTSAPDVTGTDVVWTFTNTGADNPFITVTPTYTLNSDSSHTITRPTTFALNTIRSFRYGSIPNGTAINEAFLQDLDGPANSNMTLDFGNVNPIGVTTSFGSSPTGNRHCFIMDDTYVVDTITVAGFDVFTGQFTLTNVAGYNVYVSNSRHSSGVIDYIVTTRTA